MFWRVELGSAAGDLFSSEQGCREQADPLQLGLMIGLPLRALDCAQGDISLRFFRCDELFGKPLLAASKRTDSTSLPPALATGSRPQGACSTGAHLGALASHDGRSELFRV